MSSTVVQTRFTASDGLFDRAPNAMFNPNHTAMPVHVVIAPSKCSQKLCNRESRF